MNYRAAWQLRLIFPNDLFNGISRASQIAPVDADIDVENGSDIVVINYLRGLVAFEAEMFSRNSVGFLTASGFP